MTNTHHLRGPWQAVIEDRGDAYPSLDAARAVLGERGSVNISVRRASALPDNWDVNHFPSSHHATGDVAYELDDVHLFDDEYSPVRAEARFAQAQAMAAGLNAAGGTHV